MIALAAQQDFQSQQSPWSHLSRCPLAQDARKSQNCRTCLMGAALPAGGTLTNQR